MLLRRISIIALVVAGCSGAVAIAHTNFNTNLLSSSSTSSTKSPSLLLSNNAQNIRNSPVKQPQQGGWLKDLNLSPQQKQNIKEIRKLSKDNITQKREAIKKTQQELEKLMASNDAKKQNITQKFKQLQTLRQELATIQFENNLAIRDLLNPDQRKKFVENMGKQNRR
jgi:Spy/CpxP family protein refolding chaperone